MQYTLRSPNSEEILQVIALLRECGLYYESEDTPEKLTAKLSQDGPRGLVIGAFDQNGTLVGFVMASFDGWAAIVWHYCVHPDLRSGTGLGLTLGRAILRRLRSLGADRVYALVETKNVRMHRFASAAGFEVDAGTPVLVIGRKI